MAQAAVEILGERLSSGVVLVKEGYAGQAATGLTVELIEAGHPIPDERGVRGSARIIDLLEQAQAQDLVIALVSGGASAIMVSPVPGVTLADIQSLTALLLACGASVNEINCMRKHLEQLKGGKLARQASPAPVAALILSDVVGDPLDSIGSGPTAPDPTTFADAYAVMKKYGLLQQAPQAIVDHLRSGFDGDLPDNPKAGDPLFREVYNLLIGSNTLAAEAAVRQAQIEGFNTLLLTTYLEGEARYAGRFLAAIARQIDRDGRPLPRPACLVAGGETTVTVRGDGLGGRNQEVALGAVEGLSRLHEVALVTLATDGGDGLTPAAGAVATSDTLQRAQQLGMDLSDHLQRNDAYHFFEPLDDLLIPGPTLTNVNDLALLFVF
jgi:hydroxypyruvate reductase